jgi:uncharacterized protein involved in exopolysaccharide biosynthesis
MMRSVSNELQDTIAGSAPWPGGPESLGALDVLQLLFARRRWLLAGALVAALLGFGAASLVAPSFTARTSLLPPMQQQSAATAALASLGALAGLAGGAARTPSDQFVALMRSDFVTNRVIERFKLLQVYDERHLVDGRKELAKNVQISIGKKDGLITVEVDDHDPVRAANIANAHVEYLRELTNNLAVSEAKQRRLFFEQQLQQTQDKLIAAQRAMQGSGITQGALKAEPKATAESYARLRAEVTTAEIRLQGMSRLLTENTPELVQLRTTANALRAELAKAEQQKSGSPLESDYVARYRDFKYQEAMFEMLARQYEMARVDESREGALIQVVDVATPPEIKSKPLRGLITLACAMFGLLLASTIVVARGLRRGEP